MILFDEIIKMLGVEPDESFNMKYIYRNNEPVEEDCIPAYFKFDSLDQKLKIYDRTLEEWYECPNIFMDLMSGNIEIEKDVDMKPCPFCGGEPTIIKNDNGSRWFVHCGNCGCKMPQKPTCGEAIMSWNGRYNED